jgi:hypothetical protein
MPLPQDLVQFEHDLEAEFAAEKEDAERRPRMDKVIARRARPDSDVTLHCGRDDSRR